MKKKSPFRLFLRGFLQSVFIIAAMLAVGYGSYKLTLVFYRASDRSSAPKAAASVSGLTDTAKADPISKNLIFCVDEEKREISHLVLEIFNSYTYNMDYVTIPADAEITISNQLYEKIYSVNEEVPQIIRISDLGNYFPADEIYNYGILILEDYLGVDVSYYTALRSDFYKEIFTSKDMTFTYQSSQETDESSPSGYHMATFQTKVQVLKDNYLKQLKNATSNDMEDYIKEQYKEFKSNLPVQEKLNYALDYVQINTEHIYYHSVYGEENVDGGYHIFQKETSSFLRELEGNTQAYTQTQKEAMKDFAASSKDLSIRILNGSGITGLAATYRDMLTQDGYTVSGIGNYQGDKVTNTRIIVREEGIGKDIAGYFKNVQPETGELTEGCDIEIILGEADHLN